MRHSVPHRVRDKRDGALQFFAPYYGLALSRRSRVPDAVQHAVLLRRAGTQSGRQRELSSSEDG
ncbi:hypothetical protein BRAS3843_3040001 [Bradyrhizobium sp. STM 3843]|nr:hypothetical protein BRAS3843_3040001 [Bradyrhizobium sp. STM 3843]